MIRTKVICNSKYLRKYVSIFVRSNNNSTGPNEGSETVGGSLHEASKRKLFEHAVVMSTGGDGGLPILSRDTEMVSPPRHAPEHGDLGFFFFVNFFSLIPERLDAARAFGSLAFFMRTKARRDRVMYMCRSTPFARGYPYLYKVFAFYFDHTLGTLFFSNTPS